MKDIKAQKPDFCFFFPCSASRGGPACVCQHPSHPDAIKNMSVQAILLVPGVQLFHYLFDSLPQNFIFPWEDPSLVHFPCSAQCWPPGAHSLLAQELGRRTLRLHHSSRELLSMPFGSASIKGQAVI